MLLLEVFALYFPLFQHNQVKEGPVSAKLISLYVASEIPTLRRVRSENKGDIELTHCIWRVFHIFIIVSSTILSKVQLSETKPKTIQNRAIFSCLYLTYIEFGASLYAESRRLLFCGIGSTRRRVKMIKF